MRQWQQYQRSHSDVQMPRVVLGVVAVAVVATFSISCGQGTSTPAPIVRAPVATPTARPTPVAALPGAIHLVRTVTHLTPMVTRTPPGTFTQFKLPSPGNRWLSSLPAGLAPGSDGAMWFGGMVDGVIRSLTPSGTLVTYTLPPEGDQQPQPEDTAWGPDGALWFTLIGNIDKRPDRIGRLTPAGELNQFSIRLPYFGPLAIVAGPDGAMWFDEEGPDSAIGRISMSGAITQFLPVPLAQRSGIHGLVSGPDGALWFTTADALGRLTPAGASHLFALPGAYPTGASANGGIASGPDGALWFTEVSSNRIGRLTTAGAYSSYPIPTLGASYPIPTLGAVPFAICAGHDGKLWFVERYTSKLGRLTPTGVMTEIAVPTKLAPGDDDLNQIAAGPGGAIWFIEQQTDQIGFLV